MYLQVLNIFGEFDVFLWQASFVAGDVDDGAVEFLNFDIEFWNVDLQFFDGLDWDELFFCYTVQLGEELVNLLLEFRFFFVGSGKFLITNN